MKTTNKLVMCGVFSALSFVFLFLAGIIPGIELTLYALASAMPALAIVECAGMGTAALKRTAGVKVGAGGEKDPGALPGISVYVVTTLLGFFLMPNKLAVIPYAIFFGIYGMIKYYIEKFNVRGVRIVLKTAIFGGIFSGMYFLAKDVLLGAITMPDLAFPILLVCAVAFLFLYDWIFSMGINYYIAKMHRRI